MFFNIKIVYKIVVYIKYSFLLCYMFNLNYTIMKTKISDMEFIDLIMMYCEDYKAGFNTINETKCLILDLFYGRPYNPLE